MKTFKKILCTTIAAVVSLAATGCGDRNIVGGITSSDNITILTTAAVGTPTTENDPYKQYIKDNWFTDKFIINDITADTIAKGIGQYITNVDSDRYSVSAIMWLSNIKDYIDALLKYGDFDFVAKAFKIYNITDTRFELIHKLYNYFYG